MRTRKAERPTVETIVERIGPMRNKQAAANTVETSEARRERRAAGLTCAACREDAERLLQQLPLQIFEVAPRLLQDFARLFRLLGGKRAAAQTG